MSMSNERAVYEENDDLYSANVQLIYDNRCLQRMNERNMKIIDDLQRVIVELKRDIVTKRRVTGKQPGVGEKHVSSSTSVRLDRPYERYSSGLHQSETSKHPRTVDGEQSLSYVNPD